MTAERCPQCDIVVNADATGQLLRCESCGMRFARARKAKGRPSRNLADDGELGIHPALARRYQRVAQTPEAEAPSDPSLRAGRHLPSVQLSPSFVDEAKAPFDV
ncbi:MAG: hypothetical protein ACO32I_09455, partial [Candidatus Limnocylindrus sp.]